MKVGILGGAFNPPHTGHLLLANFAIEKLGLDKFIFIPTANPSHKQISEGWDAGMRSLMIKIASFNLPPHALEKILLKEKIFCITDASDKPGSTQIYNMVFIWFMETYTKLYFLHHEHKISVSDMEISRGGVSYTVDTVEELLKKDPSMELYLIIGQDQARDFDKWKDYEKIAEFAKVYVAARGENNINELKMRFKFMNFLDTPRFDISSSEIRKRYKEGNIIDYYLPEIMSVFIRCKSVRERFVTEK
jgi:nicotinate-nucleotide adenylyltransferase